MAKWHDDLVKSGEKTSPQFQFQANARKAKICLQSRLLGELRALALCAFQPIKSNNVTYCV